MVLRNLRSKNKNKGDKKVKALPVTLLSGFLGSGKTTLLQHILSSEHGLKIAVVVNDIGAVNVDANLIKQTHSLKKTDEKVIALQNGCICCTLRGDLLEELVRLSKLQEFDYIIIESSGISEPEQVAETFDARLAEQMDSVSGLNGAHLDEDMLKVLREVKKAGGLDKFAKLDTTVTVIDAFSMFNDFETGDLLSSRRDDVTPEDERTVSDLMVDQIEFADVVVLNKTDMVNTATKKRVITLIKTLNPRAEIIETSYGKVDVRKLVNTGKFNLEVAQTGPGWLQELHQMTVREINGHNVVTPKPETEEYNVSSMVYRRHRPFHPERLWTLVYDKFILQLEHPDDEEDEEDDDEDAEEEEDDENDDDSVGSDTQMANSDSDIKASPPSKKSASSSDNGVSTANTTPVPDSPTKKAAAAAAAAVAEDNVMDESEDMFTPENAVILENRSKHPIFRRLFRSKGQFCLATRTSIAGDWSQAGAMLTLKGGQQFFCTIPDEDFAAMAAEKPDVFALVKHDMNLGGEWGDRRQEIVFIGENLDKKGLEALLDECLLNDEEWEQWQAVMRDETLDAEKRREALEDLFDDGFPDWPGEMGEDDMEHDEHDGHDHRGHKGHKH